MPYDWRLSNRYNGRRLASIGEPALHSWRSQSRTNADAQLVFVCHSMGGLVARWYIEKCGGAELTRKLITFGTPYRGAAKALGQLINGVHPGIGALLRGWITQSWQAELMRRRLARASIPRSGSRSSR